MSEEENVSKASDEPVPPPEEPAATSSEAASGDDPEAAQPSGTSEAPASEEAPPSSAAPAVVVGAHAASAKTKAAWGAPLDKLDRAWTRLDARLCAFVLLAEVLTLVFWISMKAMSTTGRGGPGMVYRCMLTALLLGVGTHLATRKRLARSDMATTAAVVVGLVAGSFWGDLGAAYFANLLAWMQNASILVFFGGASAIAKRLTLWLALLGASVATGQGKHINVDVVMRFLSPRARVPVAVLGWVAAAVVCFAGVWGFFDHVAVEDYRVPTSMPCAAGSDDQCPTPPSVKIEKVATDTSRDFFLARKQVALDLKALPKVLSGTPYNKWLTPHEWNAWVRSSGFAERFHGEDVQAMLLPEDGTGPEFRTPAITSIPGETEQVHELFVRELNFVFAFGLLVIGIRFILRSLLAIAGYVNVDPGAAHGDDDLSDAHDPNHTADAPALTAEVTR